MVWRCHNWWITKMCKVVDERFPQPISNRFHQWQLAFMSLAAICARLVIHRTSSELRRSANCATCITTIIAFVAVTSGQPRFFSLLTFLTKCFLSGIREIFWFEVTLHLTSSHFSWIVNIFVNSLVKYYFRQDLVNEYFIINSWLELASYVYVGLHTHVHVTSQRFYLSHVFMFIVIKTSLHSAQIVEDPLIHQKSALTFRRSQILGQNIPPFGEIRQPNTQM